MSCSKVVRSVFKIRKKTQREIYVGYREWVGGAERERGADREQGSEGMLLTAHNG